MDGWNSLVFSMWMMMDKFHDITPCVPNVQLSYFSSSRWFVLLTFLRIVGRSLTMSCNIQCCGSRLYFLFVGPSGWKREPLLPNVADEHDREEICCTKNDRVNSNYYRRGSFQIALSGVIARDPNFRIHPHRLKLPFSLSSLYVCKYTCVKLFFVPTQQSTP
jgi:hypothetical protein